jgi:anti-sigma B factor antagonist
MEIRERQSGDLTIIGLTGRLTITDQPGQLKEAVASAVTRGSRRILLDLSGVRYIDSTRLGELIAAHISVSRQGGRLMLVSTPGRILELLTMAGLDGVFERYDSVEAAAKSMN